MRHEYFYQCEVCGFDDVVNSEIEIEETKCSNCGAMVKVNA